MKNTNLFITIILTIIVICILIVIFINYKLVEGLSIALPEGATDIHFHEKDLSKADYSNIKSDTRHNWPKEKEDLFVAYENVLNNNVYQFDMNKVQQQANESEADYILKTGYWPWSDETKYLFMDEISKNTMIQVDPPAAMDYAMKIYNENAIRQLLSWKTKEGKFLLNGVDLGQHTGMDDRIQCGVDKNGNPALTKITYSGYNLWNGYKNSKLTYIDPEDAEKEINGFKFVNGPCNPCAPLDLNKPDYTCAFSIKTSPNDKGTISRIWQILWGL
jgi:hypothetical protein